LEDWRFIQAEPDIDGEYQEDDRDQERNAPAPFRERLCVHRFTAEDNDYERKREPDGCGRLNPACCIAALVLTRVLGNIDRSTTVLASDCEPLEEAQRREQYRRTPPDISVDRQQADQKRRSTHHRDGDEECVLAANEIANPAEQQGA
jgi:hypothetical protein